ncbi:Major facilitator superfamily domain general substrate transporter [Penicillium robsamsonii]|uniref:Major facilitator superfamily domain general substrate transporter n=1 Tax=Penicillium robsamsonii TaxID=1792511 RepID=UPI0025485A07|nr:Major facilitator superfamily domain general substrate transporter [Penicillium robsamsonii]KAJ5822429.1 Major facilitator superfamily domain general substrate transporter [Penicillium robsamsonii]
MTINPEKPGIPPRDTVQAAEAAHAQAVVNAATEKLEEDDQLEEALESPSAELELTEDMCYERLGYSFSEKKKWTIISVIFLVQTSMNFNTSLYSNAATGISEEFGVSMQAARCGAMIFLVLYAFGCELWAPWSEELGRKPILQASLFLVNVFQLPVALAPNFASIMVGRALGGLSSAGGSVTLGMIADLWEPDAQQYAVAAVVFSSVGGSVLGPVVGGFVEAFLPWRWNIWIQLIFGGFVQVAHYLFVPETRTTVMMNRIAKNMRKTGENPHIYGPTEGVSFRQRFPPRELMATWIRPFKMFLTEPIVLVLSLLSGFSDALIFMFIQSLSLVYGQWGFNTWEKGLAFIPILVGYFIAWFSFFPVISRNVKERRDHPDSERAQYESRLWWLLYTVPCLPIGLIGFAWTSLPQCHWIGSMIFAAIIGIANYAIYMATIDYMICAYGPYSASATGGNGWSRDFLAGVLTIPATPFYTNIGGKYHLEYASTILFCISIPLVIAVYVIYWKGPELRKRSPFAQRLEDARHQMQVESRRGSKVVPVSRLNSYVRSQQDLRIRPTIGSRGNSRVNSQANSRANSRRNSINVVNIHVNH